MHDHNEHIFRLAQEMYYEPMWYLDQPIFESLINTSSFNSKQLLQIARLHVKYKHILHRSEIKRCFDNFIIKAKCINANELYDITRALYNERNKKI